MPKSLERYRGRHPSKPAMFSEGFTAGRTRSEDIPIHFVRTGGFSDSHDATHSTTAPGLDCAGRMALAARKRRWVESLRLDCDDPPAHER